ncbi:MAG: hypothetical protein HY000_33070 [Planctomycetes bacterium]|nr:hypothetical protein [Planctomycetota bacterium]
MNHEEVRKRHEQILKPLEAAGEWSPTDKVLNSFLPPTVGWAILLAFLLGMIALLVWVATAELRQGG